MQAEQALRKSQVHLQAILDNCPAMIFLKDVEGRYLQVNRQLEKNLSLTSEQILGRTDAEVFEPELRPRTAPVINEYLRRGARWSSKNWPLPRWTHARIVHKFPSRTPPETSMQ